MMADTIHIASEAPMALRITDPIPDEFKDKPGEAPEPMEAVIHGSNHTDRLGASGVTRNVDAGLFHRWLDRMKAIGSPLAHHVREVSQDELDNPGATEFGHEPGLKRAAEREGAKAAEGSTVTHEGPVTADEMAAHSDTPQEDSPRAEPGVGGTQVSGTDVVTP